MRNLVFLIFCIGLLGCAGAPWKPLTDDQPQVEEIEQVDDEVHNWSSGMRTSDASDKPAGLNSKAREIERHLGYE